jgi:hypothetical protein
MATTDPGWSLGTLAYADFAFEVNLGTGAVSNAEMHNLAFVGGTTYQQFDVVGGSGLLYGGTATLDGFTGQAISYTPGSAATIYDIFPVDPTILTVTSSPTPGVLGSSMAGNYAVDVIDSGTLAGTWGVAPPTPTTGVVSGYLFSMTVTGGFNPAFSFDVDLTTGAITNASVWGSGNVSGMYGPGILAMDFTNGSGNALMGISNFTLNGGGANNNFDNGVVTPLDPSASTMSHMKFGSAAYDPTIVHNGGIVPVYYDVVDSGGMYDTGYGAGTMVK